jgi:hypothetical protein
MRSKREITVPLSFAGYTGIMTEYILDLYTFTKFVVWLLTQKGPHTLYTDKTKYKLILS